MELTFTYDLFMRNLFSPLKFL
uniref:Uncharacterized protein n=1 Tax=Anguilla anguilla TaxID=7936 RepID=A0A0E9R1K1_ANGAN